MKTLEQFHRRFSIHGPKNFLERVLFLLLLIPSFLYAFVALVRAFLYRSGILPSTESEIPVISVGNLAVGGTGKTPFVDYLISYFEKKGLRPAVVSRGYGGTFSGELAVVSDGSGPLMSAVCCGDEPFLLANRHPRALVLVAPRRRHAVSWINARKNADVILLDDAFQHLQVKRDLNIVLLDAKKPYGNGYTLPAGRLREFPSALKRADLLVLTRADNTESSSLKWNKPMIRCHHRLADRLVSLDKNEINADELAGQRGVAFAGIARPELFFQSLRDQGLDLVHTCSLPDHERYEDEVINRLLSVSESADYLVTTEKDAVKIAATALGKTCYISKLYIEISEEGMLRERLDACMTG